MIYVINYYIFFYKFFLNINTKCNDFMNRFLTPPAKNLFFVFQPTLSQFINDFDLPSDESARRNFFQEFFYNGYKFILHIINSVQVFDKHNFLVSTQTNE